jgi:hypothetical protein
MYDAMLMGDVLTSIGCLADGWFDVALAVAVMEHFERRVAMDMADDLAKLARTVYVATPIGPYPQDTVEGNPHERHVTTWAEEDWTGRGFAVVGRGRRSTVFVRGAPGGD